MKRASAILFLTAVGAPLTTGQPLPSWNFDIASIRTSDPAVQGTHLGATTNGDFKAENVSLKRLIQQAWELRDFQISGGPGWIDTDHYDVKAKTTERGPSDDEFRQMSAVQRDEMKTKMLRGLQNLLADRFQLKVHVENRELPIYGLVIVKSGAKFKPSTADEKESGSTISRADTSRTEITFRKVSISSLTKYLSGQTERIVRDQTGLKGEYDFKLTFAPNMTEGTDAPSLFTAVQEQLGLRLDAQKGPVEVLLVDSVQRPSAN